MRITLVWKILLLVVMSDSLVNVHGLKVGAPLLTTSHCSTPFWSLHLSDGWSCILVMINSWKYHSWDMVEGILKNAYLRQTLFPLEPTVELPLTSMGTELGQHWTLMKFPQGLFSEALWISKAKGWSAKPNGILLPLPSWGNRVHSSTGGWMNCILENRNSECRLF